MEHFRKCFIRKGLGETAWVLGRCQINTIQTGTLSRRAKDSAGTRIKPLLCTPGSFFSWPSLHCHLALVKQHHGNKASSAAQSSWRTFSSFSDRIYGSRRMDCSLEAGPGMSPRTECHCTKAPELHHPSWGS